MPDGRGVRVSEPRLDGAVALVTGAGRGIGRAIALRLAAAGADVVINDIDHEAGTRAAELVEERTRRRSFAVSGDVSVSAEVDAFVAEAVHAFGHLDVLVANAGVIDNAPLTETTDGAWQRVMDINLGGAFRCARAAVPHLRDEGSIVLLSSGAAWGSTRGQSNYASAKAGVIGLTRTLALELAPRLRVNAVAPGAITGDMTRATAEQIGLSFADYVVETSGRIPLGRLGEAEEVADAVCFLASPMASYVTGQVLKVGGGP
jgi:3-oxoacyl-[acyl-carrier protein] reductase